MNKLVAVLLLAAVASAKVQPDPLEGVVDCLIQNVPALVQDVEKLNADVQNQDYAALFADVQTLVADVQGTLACLKTQGAKALQVKANQAAVEDTLQCLTQYAPSIVNEAQRLVTDYQSQNWGALIGDALSLYNDGVGLVNCLQNKAELMAAVEKMMKIMETKGSFDCIFQYIPALVADAKAIIADAQAGDYGSLIAHVQQLVVDGQALVGCLKA